LRHEIAAGVHVNSFPENDIISLIGEPHRHELGESIGPNLSLGELLTAPGASGLGELALGYATADGDPRLRQVIADAHGVCAEDVVITVGGVHAMFLIALILCERDDEAVVMSPVFPPARAVLDTVRAKVRVLSLSFDRGYQVDLADFRALLSSRTKLVSIASPQNPSGVCIPERTLQGILAAMSQRCPDAHLLFDETYREAAFGEDSITPSAVGLSSKIVSVASLSKCHGAPGLRIGWAITTDKALRRQLLLGKFNTVISCSPVDEFLARHVLAQRDRIMAERRPQLAEGLARTADWVAANGDLVEWVRPDAGAICCVRLMPSVFDGDAVNAAHKVFAEAGIGIGDGRWFGEDARVFRLGFGYFPMPVFQAALDALTAALRRALGSPT